MIGSVMGEMVADCGWGGKDGVGIWVGFSRETGWVLGLGGLGYSARREEGRTSRRERRVGLRTGGLDWAGLAATKTAANVKDGGFFSARCSALDQWFDFLLDGFLTHLIHGHHECGPEAGRLNMLDVSGRGVSCPESYRSTRLKNNGYLYWLL